MDKYVDKFSQIVDNVDNFFLISKLSTFLKVIHKLSTDLSTFFKKIFELSTIFLVIHIVIHNLICNFTVDYLKINLIF